MSTFLEFSDVSVFRQGEIIFHDLNWTINQHEHWIILGETGSGKTSLLQAIDGSLHLKKGEIQYPFLPEQTDRWRIKHYINHVSFSGNLVNDANRYYQQRYNLSEEDQSPTVNDYLNLTINPFESFLPVNDLRNVELIKLSNGQTRKIQLVKALAEKPELLLLDNPFAGLDLLARKELRTLIGTLLRNGKKIILACNHLADIPDEFTHVLRLQHQKITFAGALTDYPGNDSLQMNVTQEFSIPAKPQSSFAVAVSFQNVNVQYTDKTILDNVSFEILRNEKWALTGPNGSGKSTLLSLINADNPQAYANNIVLFDEKKSRQSIWKLKRRIGYFSPELYATFYENLTVQQVLSTGITGTYIPKTNLSSEEKDRVHKLLAFFKREHLLEKPYLRLSTGEKQLMFFLRVFMVDFDLLILDEPFQAFDEMLIHQCRFFIDQICRNKTLLFVSHYPSEFPAGITHFMHLNGGSITTTGKLS